MDELKERCPSRCCQHHKNLLTKHLLLEPPRIFFMEPVLSIYRGYRDRRLKMTALASENSNLIVSPRLKPIWPNSKHTYIYRMLWFPLHFHFITPAHSLC